jgi:coatomer protein complex subunit epsilon
VSTVAEWIADPACAGNAMTLLVAGMIYANEGNYVEALKSCHTGLNLEMCGPGRAACAQGALAEQSL